jgi:hypothetical protein
MKVEVAQQVQPDNIGPVSTETESIIEAEDSPKTEGSIILNGSMPTASEDPKFDSKSFPGYENKAQTIREARRARAREDAFGVDPKFTHSKHPGI